MYTLQAIVGDVEHLKREAATLPLIARPQGKALIPLTDAVRYSCGQIPWLPFTDEGLDPIPQPLLELCTNLSANGPIAYIEAEFTGGQGTQASFVFDRGKLVLPLYVAEDAINAALRTLGVSKAGARDEFDALELGAHRHTEDWSSNISDKAQPTEAELDLHLPTVAQRKATCIVLLVFGFVGLILGCVATQNAFMAFLFSGFSFFASAMSWRAQGRHDLIIHADGKLIQWSKGRSTRSVSLDQVAKVVVCTFDPASIVFHLQNGQRRDLDASMLMSDGTSRVAWFLARRGLDVVIDDKRLTP